MGQQLRKTSKQGFVGNFPKKASYIRKRASERLVRMEPPVDHWTDVFGNSGGNSGDGGIPRPVVSTAGPWQVSAFCLLGMIVVLSAIFLHLVTDSGDKNRANRAGGGAGVMAASRRGNKVKRKKTDEWSEDEEEQNSDGGAYRADNEGTGGVGGGASTAAAALASTSSPHLYYPYQPRFPNVQEHRHRKPSVGGATSTKELLGQGSAIVTSNTGSTLHNRNYYANPSGVAAAAGSSNFTAAPISRKNSRSPRLTPLLHHPQQLSQHHLLPSTGLEGFETTLTASESMGGEKFTASNLEQFQTPLLRPFEMVRQLSPVSSMASMDASNNNNNFNNNNNNDNGDMLSPHLSATSIGVTPLRDVARLDSSEARAAFHHKTSSLELSSASDDFDIDETPRAGRYTRQTLIEYSSSGLMPLSGLTGPGAGAIRGGTHNMHPGMMMNMDTRRNQGNKEAIPFIPRLEESADALQMRNPAPPPPLPISVEELRLVQMETGNAPREQQQQRLLQAYPGRAVPMEDKTSNVSSSTPSPPDSGERNDPRKSIQHKRSNLTLSTDSASSLQSSIEFAELKLQEVIGGGGFGQVWKAVWRGTPVAVKVLTGTAQSKNVSKAILEEFAAEINLLKVSYSEC